MTRRPLFRSLGLALAVALGACTSFHYDDAGRDAASDATTVVDGQSSDVSRGASEERDTSPAADGGSDVTGDVTVDGPLDAGLDTGAQALADSGLSALYVPPGADAAPCTRPGHGPDAGCAGGYCIPSAPDAGRCQAPSPPEGTCGTCACVTASDCDQGWLCYAGSCNLSCLLASESCGSDPCVDIGNATMGVCLNPG